MPEVVNSNTSMDQRGNINELNRQGIYKATGARESCKKHTYLKGI